MVATPVPRVALISMHTSPLDLPGTGDAGGMNVYVRRTADQLVRAGAAVDVFTRARGPHEVGTTPVGPDLRFHGLAAGPLAPMPKEQLPAVVDNFADALAAHHAGAGFDVVHGHYWLSGLAATRVARAWQVPSVHTMHTMAVTKNAQLAPGDVPESDARLRGEESVVRRATRLIANTAWERQDLIHAHGADPSRVDVVPPGVDLSVFHPGDRVRVREAVGVGPDDLVLLFVGRQQLLKAPDHLLRMAHVLLRSRPGLRERLRLLFVGGSSGRADVRWLPDLADRLGIADLVRFDPPAPASTLADYYRAADLTVVPSVSETFGLVALESQASGTPVLGSDVPGLCAAVPPDGGGVLVPGRRVATWAGVLDDLLFDPGRRGILSSRGVARARSFDWANTASATLASYDRAGRQVGRHLAA